MMRVVVVKLMMVMMMRTTTTMMLMILLMVMTTENLQALVILFTVLPSGQRTARLRGQFDWRRRTGAILSMGS